MRHCTIKMNIDKTRIGREHDGRVKLSELDRASIMALYKMGTPIREIARQYEKIVSRRMIQFVLFPERLKTVNYPGHYKKYYRKDEWRLTMRKHRAKKKALLLK